jgi:general secretion pathway protein N
LSSNWARIALILLVAAATLGAFAPAAWLGDWVAQRSRLRLVDATGTLWNGSAMLAVSDGTQARLVSGRLSWRVRWAGLASGKMVLTLAHPFLERAVDVSLDRRAVRLEAGRARMPAGVLAVLGAPFNSLRPGGELRLQWDTLGFGRANLQGSLQLDWSDAQSALSQVAPLGDFRLTLTGRGSVGDVRLVTLEGPLLLEGRGVLERGRLRFSGSADAVPEMRASLTGLIGVLGPRAGDKALLRWESQV